MKPFWTYALVTAIFLAPYYGQKLYLIIKKRKALKAKSSYTVSEYKKEKIDKEDLDILFITDRLSISHDIKNIENVAHYLKALDSIKAYQNKYRAVFPLVKVQIEVSAMITELEGKDSLIMKPINRHFPDAKIPKPVL